jgi:LDH2 family malate/lactate/ureidoglycolate dehydrogenase
MTVRHDPAGLRRLAAGILTALGVGGEDANLVADSLVQAELWGHHSHGLLRLPWYVARLRSGAIRADAEPERLIDLGALLLLDAHDGLGQVMADHARALAVSRAKVHGVAAVGVRGSNHFGTAMYFTRRAAAEGCVAILTTNASPAMAPWGGREKRIGTNPWSIAAPWRERVVALDIANTAVARGKLYLAKQRGDAIPEHWALDAEGVPTADAAAGIAGTIMPMAGHKGYAISFMMDVLSGALTGSAVGTSVLGPYVPEGRSGAGHLLIAIDVAALGPIDEYDARVDAMVEEARSAPLAVGHDRILVPGEFEDLAEAAALAAGGIELPDQTIAELAALAHELALPLPAGWEPVAHAHGGTP